MFNKAQYILETRSDALVLHVVDKKDEYEVVNTNTVPFDFSTKKITSESITTALQKVFEKSLSPISNVRVLMAEEHLYVFQLSFDEKTKNNKIRSAILELAQKIVPEEIDDETWDYKLLDENATYPKIAVSGLALIDPQEKSQKALVMVPVGRIFKPLVSALNDRGCKVEAVENSALAGDRHSNPIIGLAMKTDLKGKDASVLNIQSTQVSTTSTIHSEDGSETIKPTQNKKTIVGILLFLLLVALATATLVFYFGYKMNSPKVEPKQTTEATTVLKEASKIDTKVENVLITATQSATPNSELSFDPKSISVQVLNGSSISGAAASVAAQLRTNGFEKITTANSQTAEVNGFLVQSKQTSIKADLFSYLDTVLKDVTTTLPKRSFAVNPIVTFENSPLPSEGEFDLLIVVGK